MVAGVYMCVEIDVCISEVISADVMIRLFKKIWKHRNQKPSIRLTVAVQYVN